MLIRPKAVLHLEIPGSDASALKHRNFNVKLVSVVAKLLSSSGMSAEVLDPDVEADYSKWNVLLDGSLSKEHMVDGYCKCE